MLLLIHATIQSVKAQLDRFLFYCLFCCLSRRTDKYKVFTTDEILLPVAKLPLAI